MKQSDLKQLIREEIQGILSEGKLNMQKVYKILKTAGYDPKISEGNRLLIKAITVWGKERLVDYGGMKITPSGALYGDDLWGIDIETEEQVIPALNQYIKDQRELEVRNREEFLKNNPDVIFPHDLP